MRDGGPVIASVDREQRLTGLDWVAGHDLDTSDDTAALDRECDNLTRGLDDADAATSSS